MTSNIFNNAEALAIYDASIEDTNGTHVFSHDKSLYGFITATEHLVITKEVDDLSALDPATGNWPDIPLSKFGSENGIKDLLGGTVEGMNYRSGHAYLYIPDNVIIFKIGFLNYRKLVIGGMDVKIAAVVAALRMRWVALGAWAIARQDTRRPFVEHEIVKADASGSDEEKIAAATSIPAMFAIDVPNGENFMKQLKEPSTGMNYVITMAESLWCAEEWIVRTTGHHFKDENLDKLVRYIEACHEKNFTVNDAHRNAAFFRVAIHPFGLRALPIMAAHFAIHGKLGNAGLLRFMGAPNGFAVVTTTAACLRAMASEHWYGKMKEAFSESMAQLNSFEKIIMANKFGYHLACGVYGETKRTEFNVDGKRYSLEEAKEIGAALASIAQGFITAMKNAKDNNQIDGFSFENAKSLAKPAGNAPLATLRFRSLVLHGVNSVIEAKTTEAAIKNALPPSATKTDAKET